VLRDLIDSGCLPVVQLTQIYRQAAESDIVVNAHKMMDEEAIDLGKRSKDFLFIRQNTVEGVIETMLRLLTEKLPAYVGAEAKSIQLLTPVRRGALGVATANEVWMMENAVYSILSPEGFAAILYRDGKQAERAAENMRLTSRDLLELGVIEKIIPEKEPATFENIRDIARELEPELLDFIGRYGAMSRDELANQRYERFRKF